MQKKETWRLENTFKTVDYLAALATRKLDTNLILANVNKHIRLDESESDYFCSLLKPKALKKKDFLLRAGDPCNTFYYVNAGALRAFYRGEDAKETTQMFAVSDWWITDMPCFVNEDPAMVFIEAITDSTILQLTKFDMDSLLARIPKFERFFRIIMQNSYVREQLRALHLISLPAEVRYNNFIKKYPSIVNQVTQKNIASYLGITPEFLSAIRSQGRKTTSKTTS